MAGRPSDRARPRRRLRTWLGATLAAVVVVTACRGSDDADVPGSQQAAERLPATACPTGTPTGVQCFAMPIDVGDQTGSLLVAWVDAPGGGDSDAPLLLLPGDPASRAVSNLGQWRTMARQLGRDVVVVDRRGAGGSTPSLSCPNLDPEVLLLGDPGGRATYRSALASCADVVEGQGLDPNDFTSDLAADDLEAVREALDIDRWHVVVFGSLSADAVQLVDRHAKAVASLTVEASAALPTGAAGLTSATDLLDRLRADPTTDASLSSAVVAADGGLVSASLPLPSVDPDAPSSTELQVAEQVTIDADALRTAAVLAAAGGRDATELIREADSGTAQLALDELIARLPVAADWSAGVAHTLACSQTLLGSGVATLRAATAALPGFGPLLVGADDADACQAWPTTPHPLDGRLPDTTSTAAIVGPAGVSGLPGDALLVPTGTDRAACLVRTLEVHVADSLAAGDDVCGGGPAATVAGEEPLLRPVAPIVLDTSASPAPTTTLPPLPEVVGATPIVPPAPRQPGAPPARPVRAGTPTFPGAQPPPTTTAPTNPTIDVPSGVASPPLPGNGGTPNGVPVDPGISPDAVPTTVAGGDGGVVSPPPATTVVPGSPTTPPRSSTSTTRPRSSTTTTTRPRTTTTPRPRPSTTTTTRPRPATTVRRTTTTVERTTTTERPTTTQPPRTTTTRPRPTTTERPTTTTSTTTTTLPPETTTTVAPEETTTTTAGPPEETTTTTTAAPPEETTTTTAAPEETTTTAAPPEETTTTVAEQPGDGDRDEDEEDEEDDDDDDDDDGPPFPLPFPLPWPF